MESLMRLRMLALMDTLEDSNLEIKQSWRSVTESVSEFLGIEDKLIKMDMDE